MRRTRTDGILYKTEVVMSHAQKSIGLNTLIILSALTLLVLGGGNPVSLLLAGALAGASLTFATLVIVYYATFGTLDDL